MAADPRLDEVEAFIRRHLEAEAALAIAALGEPDDDTYLEVERRAKEFYAPQPTLGPLESRRATPGGRLRRDPIDVTESVRPGALYAIGSAGPGAWVALVGGRRDLRGSSIGEALLVRSTADGLRITGRAGADPFTSGIAFEPAGGEPVDLGRAEGVTILREPRTPEHAEYLRGWGSRS